MCDELLAASGQHVYHRKFYHRIASGLLSKRRAGYVDKYLSCQCGVVDAHVELETLILCGSADTLAHEVHTVSHVAYSVYRLNSENVCLVAGEIRVGLDCLCHLVEACAILEFNVYHTAVYTLAERNGH